MIDAAVELLAELLLGLLYCIELGRPALGGGGAEGLFKEPAGLQAVGSAVALRLHGGLALGRDRHLDDARHRLSFLRCGVGCRSLAAVARYCRAAGSSASASGPSKCKN